MAVYGTFFGLFLGSLSNIFLDIGVIFYIIMAVLIYFSFRPYWQINKTYVTGEMGSLELIVNQIGDMAARLGEWMSRALIAFVGWLIELIFTLITHL